MKKEFLLAFNEVLDDKQLPREVVLEALEAAMVSAYRKTVNASSAQHVEAKFDLDSGKVEIFAEKEVVEDVQDERTEVTLEVAEKYDPEAELGSIAIVESTPGDFGRVAAQTARQVIQQRIREAERQSQHDHYKTLEGEIVNGVVQAVNYHGITMGLDRKAEGQMPRNHQIRGERFRLHDRVRALLLEVKSTPRGPQIILSRAHRKFLRRLLEDEVPEIYNGMVEIRSIAREPGYRSKVAVAAVQPGIDPVGACVGIRGVRIQAIVRELHDEKIDVIEWNPDPDAFIAKALSPARVNGVYLNEIGDTKTATVVVPEDQLSLAIGRDGQNARLAAKLTGWRIDIKSLPEATSDALNKMQEAEFDEEAEALAEMAQQVEAVLVRKNEGRPIPPEEYQLLSRFVNRVETGAEDRRQAKLDARRALEEEAKENIPVTAFDIPLEELGISPRIAILMTGEGYSTIGELMLQLELDPDVVLALNGVGPKTMEDIQEVLSGFEFPEPVVVEEPDAEPGDAEAAGAEIELAAEGAEGVAAAAEGADAGAADAEAEAEVAAEETALDAAPETVDAEAAAPELVEDLAAEEGEEAKDEIKTEEGLEPAEAEFAEDDVEGLFQSEEDKKKPKKRKYRQVEYDPDLDVTIVRRVRKGEGDEFDEDNWDKYLD